MDAWRRVDGIRPLVIFEAIGVPGMLDAVLRAAPPWRACCVVGSCMQTDTCGPMLGHREAAHGDQFSFGYDPFEFADTLAHRRGRARRDADDHRYGAASTACPRRSTRSATPTTT